MEVYRLENTQLKHEVSLNKQDIIGLKEQYNKGEINNQTNIQNLTNQYKNQIKHLEIVYYFNYFFSKIIKLLINSKKHAKFQNYYINLSYPSNLIKRSYNTPNFLIISNKPKKITKIR